MPDLPDPERLHRDVAIIVAPSPIHGIGLFAAQPINCGQVVHLWGKDDWRFIRRDSVREGTAMHEMCERFCVETKDGYHCPRKFACMSIGWLLNHSYSPNIEERRERHFAMRNIAKGEELTIDYRTLDEHLSNLPGALKKENNILFTVSE